MDIVEIVAIIILILAIVILLYYIISAKSNVLDKVKDYVPASMDTGEPETMPSGAYDNEEDKVSMGDKIKYTFKDVPSSLNNSTDLFSKKLDSFLDEKSEELIEDWSLVTKDDLSDLEERCDTACESIDDLEKRFNDYQTNTDDNIADLDTRLKALEDLDKD
ncbi:hypothetical protein ACA135_00465 [Methanobrevibacter acididurans]|uniref:hypothetical protein n=1 Tax=Methanobrevibacter acididurans TaxID=120963 RepID=UPI0038FC21F6